MSEAAPVCLYTILFTLKEKKPSENQYVQMLLLWLSQLIQGHVLTEKDSLQLYLDTLTYEYITTSTMFHRIISKLPCVPRICLLESPSTLLEGCSWKYSMDSSSYTQEILIYCDLDIYICKPLGAFCKDMIPNTLYVQPEGPISDPNYGAHFKQEELQIIPAGSPGFSAGKFILVGKQVAGSFFNAMSWIVSSNKTISYYCLEQPLFNYIVYRQFLTAESSASYIDTTTLSSSISVNFHGYTKGKTVFLDCMGEPGNGSLHLEKFVQAMCLFHIEVL
jgi:hypothetical protein